MIGPLKCRRMQCVYIHNYTPCNEFRRGIMFLTHQSVSQSVNPVFLVGATPLKPLNRISRNFVEMKDLDMHFFTWNADLIFLTSNLYPFWTLAKIILCNSDETGFLSDCPSLMHGIAIRCIQHSQAMLERGVCELAHSFFHYLR